VNYFCVFLVVTIAASRVAATLFLHKIWVV
jgi:hypothetical protein